MNYSQPSTPPSKLAFTLVGHEDTIESLAFLPDGCTVASASADSTKFWDVATGRERRTFEYDDEFDFVYARCLSPNGECFVTVDSTSTIRFRDTTDDRLIRDPIEHPSLIRDVVFSDDGSTFAFTDRDGKVTVLSMTSNAEPRAFDVFDTLSMPIALSPDGRLLAIRDMVGHGVRVFEVASGQEVGTVTGHRWYVHNIAFSSNSQTLASADSETLKLWELSTGRELCSFAADGSSSLAFSPDECWIASGDKGTNRTALHGVVIGREHGSVTGHHIGFSKDGSRIVTGSTHEEILVVNAGTGEEIFTLAGHHAAVKCIAVAPGGQMIATGGMDNAVKIWDMRTAREVCTFTDHRGGVAMIAFSADGRTLASVDDVGLGKFWDVATARITRTIGIGNRESYILAFATDLQIVFWSTIGEHKIRAEEVATGREIYTVRCDSLRSGTITVSPSGRFASAVMNDGVVAWELDTGKRVSNLNVRDRLGRVSVNAISFSPDDRLLAIGFDGGKVSLWNLAKGEFVHEMRAFAFGDVHSLCFSPDGKFLAASCPESEGTTLLEVDTGRKLKRVRDLHRAVFSSDGRVLIGTRAVNTVRLWE